MLEVNDELYFIESCLPQSSAFVKYNTNLGLWKFEHYNEALGSFTRWTYETTGHYLMVSDLQGIEVDEKFVLTDPAILSRDLMRFGCTNLGPQAADRVLSGLNSMEAMMHLPV